jgi:ABC-type bacteriocin/lantibiotic exporter with double-glycine peptidase domain
VGSGKTTLLRALLNLLPLSSGSMRRADIEQKVSYTCQQPRMFNTTVRENILMSPVDKNDHSSLPEKYFRILKATQLIGDLKNLAGSDLTQIGSNGINLSGGQK